MPVIVAVTFAKHEEILYSGFQDKRLDEQFLGIL